MKGKEREKGKGKGREGERKGKREIESGFSTTKLGKEVLKGIERELIGKLGSRNHLALFRVHYYYINIVLEHK